QDDRPRPALDERIQVFWKRHRDRLERRWKGGWRMRGGRRLSRRNRGEPDRPGQKERRRRQSFHCSPPIHCSSPMVCRSRILLNPPPALGVGLPKILERQTI